MVNKVILFSLLPFLLAFSFLFFIFYRQKRESDVRRNMAETEMKALRAQMNPHFIFNSLNSIYLFIQNNQSNEAGDYLLKFSKLIRQVLEHSRLSLITLEEDIDNIKLYMDLESIRQPFLYEVYVDASVPIDQLLVPPLILQPFVENSILHGFREKQGDALITISVHLIDNELRYTTQDNGTLPTKKMVHVEEGKKQSLGTAITEERLRMINTIQHSSARFINEDLYDDQGNYSGRKTTIYLPIQHDV
jgi:LytS/YehU family sensor histidine kinase